MIVERSGNHCHLTQETFKRLFKRDEPTIKRRLKNENYFVCEERVTYNSLGKEIDLTILGPFRKYNQIELSRSTEIARDWPSGYSGDVTNEVGVWFSSGGALYHTSAICIVSIPHAHVPSNIKYERTGTLFVGSAHIQASKIYFEPSITVESIHLDNDWYNALNCTEGTISVKSNIY